MSFLAHQAAYRTTRWAAWRIRNNRAIAADKQWHKDNDDAMSEAMARVFGPPSNSKAVQRAINRQNRRQK